METVTCSAHRRTYTSPPIQPPSTYSAFTQIAGIVGATSYSGRRTWLTVLSAKGVGVRVLAEMAGHASIWTIQRYIDINDEQMCCAAELI